MALQELREGGISFPPYSFGPHSGPVLVCGNAWCLHEDVQAARKIPRFATAPVIGVNGVAYNLKVDFLFSQCHPHKLEKWRIQQERRHSAFTVHAGGKPEHAPKHPWVDYWWRGVSGHGTSTWAARKLAHFLGFEEVLLCGMPLAPGGYQGGREFAKHFLNIEGPLTFYREGVLKDTHWFAGCTSMSGWTREVLGAPALYP